MLRWCIILDTILKEKFLRISMAINKEKVNSVLMRYEEILASMQDPGVINDKERYLKLSRELGEMEPKVATIKAYFDNEKKMEEALELLQVSDDEEIKLLATEELNEAKADTERLEHDIALILAPRDPRDERNVIVEIRGGAGGEEAALFANTLFKMYSGYAQSKGFSIDVIDTNETELGGYKEIVFEISGKGAYSRFKFESGVHRVQRVPVTETSGRVHTSTVTVAVLPEAEATEVKINPDDLRIDTYRASGKGGQHVNRTDSAIRITHIPTGIVVQCQDERSQYKNKDRAMSVLSSRLLEMAESKAKNEVADTRKNQVGTGERSEKIRTYNYHQGRVSDHRIGLTLYKLEAILAGDLDEIIDALTIAGGADDLVVNSSDLDED